MRGAQAPIAVPSHRAKLRRATCGDLHPHRSSIGERAKMPQGQIALRQHDPPPPGDRPAASKPSRLQRLTIRCERSKCPFHRYAASAASHEAPDPAACLGGAASKDGLRLYASRLLGGCRSLGKRLFPGAGQRSARLILFDRCMDAALELANIWLKEPVASERGGRGWQRLAGRGWAPGTR
jgi:hypothetical protein